MDPEVGVSRMSPLFRPVAIEEDVLEIGGNLEAKPFQFGTFALCVRDTINQASVE